MDVLIVLAILGLVLVYLILPWINFGKIQVLRREIAHLKRDMAQLQTRSKVPGDDGAAQFQAEANTEPAEGGHRVEKTYMRPPEPITSPSTASASEGGSFNSGISRKRPLNLHSETPAENPVEERSEGFEHQFGRRASVWLGAVALALAGFFLVKYSIEIGLLSPTVRVTMGIIFGSGLLYAGNHIRMKPGFANGRRIAQALSGAGIAVLYASFYAATSIYDLIPPFAAFAGMAVTTAIAVALSVWHGRPIALLGLLGGFLTPALVGSPHPQASILFIYIFLVLGGLMAIIRLRGWWPMGIPAVLGAYSWVPMWLHGGHFKPDDTLWLGLFLLASATTVVIASKQQYEEDRPGMADLLTAASALNHLALCGAIVLMGITAAQGGFGATAWCLFGILAAGGLGLARSNQKLYCLLPWTSAAVSSVMLATWQYGTVQEFALVLGIFAVLHAGGAYHLQSRSRDPLIWAGLVGAAGLGYYLIGYFKIHFNPLYAETPLLWGILALALAAAATYMLMHLVDRVPGDYARRQHLLAVYAGVVAAFVSIGLTVELKREFLSVAVAAEVLAVAWINTKVDIKALRWIAALTACAFGFLLIPQLLLVMQLAAFSLVEAKLYLQESVPIVNWPVFQLGVPALCLMSGSYLLRREKDDRLVFALEVAAIGLFGLMGYYLTRHIFHLNENVLFVKPGFVERGITTNVFFIYGLACLRAGNRFKRGAVLLGGLVLSGIAIFRIVYFDLFLYNPVWSAQSVGELPILNGLLLPYGLPILWIWAGMKELSRFKTIVWNRYGYAFMLLLAFVLASMDVRQFFHGTRLDLIVTGSAEIYTYSVIWLIFGIGLLFLGTLRHDVMIRVASLPIVLLAIAKVFLYDASALAGLWRVFSFFCLGLCLLSISWFYSRFVFNAGRR
jgi:uncharacterized membrane protein